MVEYLKDANPALFSELAEDQTKHGIVDINKLGKGYSGLVTWHHTTPDTGAHQWDASMSARVTRGVGCPYCSGRLAIPGYTDFAAKNPEAAAFWHPTKNARRADTYKPGSKEVVWWQCPEGHEWEATVASRNMRMTQDCDYCKDMMHTHPILASQWHPTKNPQPTPAGVGAYSSKKYWWICSKGHETHSSPAAKHTRGENGKHDKPVCAVCSGKQVLAGYNDLATFKPDLAKQWHPTKNGSKKPTDYTKGSGAKVWWLGDCGHEWEAVISSRALSGNGCSKCGYKNWLQDNKTSIKTNNLQETHPEVAKQWHPTKNGNITPEMRTAGSVFKAWWICDKGHEWEATINRRTKGSGKHKNRGSGCHYCTNQKVLTNYNDLATTHPELLSEWDYNKNSSFDPEKIIAGSNINKYWWKCHKGHSWLATSNDRATGYGCPECSYTRYVSAPEKELADYLKESLPHLTIHTSRYGVIKGELDIYIPAKNIAIEFNGLYWHSEAAGKTKWYHHSKYEACKGKGIQLIQIWEDDWGERKEFIKLALLHKLQEADPALRIGARKLTPVSVDYAAAAEFLEINHIQGAVQGSKYYALIAPATETDSTPINDASSQSETLFDITPTTTAPAINAAQIGVKAPLAPTNKKGISSPQSEQIKAILVVKKVGNAGHEGTWRIERYATSNPIPGGFTKLLKHAQTEIQKSDERIERWVTFSDNCISDGGLYKKNGFVKDAELEPDYMYLNRSKRIHKFNYRLKRFKEDPELLWDETLSEAGLAKLNSLHRIWDAGKVRWVKTVNPARIN